MAEKDAVVIECLWWPEDSTRWVAEREGSSASAESKDAEKAITWLEKAIINGMDEVLNGPNVKGPHVPVEVETQMGKTWAG